MKYRFALIGCGRISHKHIEGFVNDKNRIDLVAVCDVDQSRAEEKAKEYLRLLPDAEVSVFTDYRRMLEEIKPDVVSIATESGYHADITVECLRFGCHVIVEKPMALSTTDADRMIRTAEESGKNLAVCYQNRFNPPIIRVEKAIKNGRFGTLMNGMIQIRWNRNEEYYRQASWRGTWKLDGGTLMNQCTHGIDLLQWLMDGKVTRVYGVTRRFMRPIEAEDFGSAVLEFDNGAVGMIEGSADVFPRNLNETLSLFGTTGTAVVGGVAVNKLETWRFADADQYDDPEELVIDADQPDPPSIYGFGHTALFADFVDAIEHGRDPKVTGKDGKASLEIVLAIYQSMLERRPVDFPVDFSTEKMVGFFKK